MQDLAFTMYASPFNKELIGIYYHKIIKDILKHLTTCFWSQSTEGLGGRAGLMKIESTSIHETLITDLLFTQLPLLFAPKSGGSAYYSEVVQAKPNKPLKF